MASSIKIVERDRSPEEQKKDDAKAQVFIKKLKEDGLVSRAIVPIRHGGNEEKISVIIIKPKAKQSQGQENPLAEMAESEWNIKGRENIIKGICRGTVLSSYEADLLRLFGEVK